MFIEPVKVIVSTFAENTVDPAAPDINVEPVTINDPEIIAEPVYGNVAAAAAFNAYDAVVENDDDIAKLELNTVIELVCDDTM
jgi:hypothetical protein